jgi:hypothetical protein
VAELYIQGWPQTRIAQELGVAQGTISTDVKALYEQWRASGVRDFDLARSIELEKLNLLEREAWEAWKRSCEPSESTKVTSTGENNRRAEKTVKQRVGDSRFLDQIHNASRAGGRCSAWTHRRRLPRPARTVRKPITLT